MAQWNKSTQAYRPQDTTNHEVVMISPVPIKFTEKTDLDVRVRGSSNALVTSEYTIVLVDNA